jgi:flagellar assembly protein FliH
MAGKTISGADAAAIDRWNAPAVDRSVAEELKGARGSAAHLLTARQLDDLQRQVQDEAYKRGFEQGLADGQKEAAARAARLSALLDALVYPFRELDRAVESELAGLAVMLASRLIRRELDQDGEHMAATVRECLSVLPIGTRNVTVYLNPADADLLGTIAGASGERAWSLANDPALNRGDLRVSSDSSQVDGRLETRLKEIIFAALSDREST